MDISFLYQPGLYKITCLKNSKVYFGESANLLTRLGQHTQSLEAQQHDCKALQADFNRYGKKSFCFEILSDYLGKPFIHRALRQHYESRCIQKLEPSLRYNQPSNSSKHYVYSPTQSVKVKNQIFPSLPAAASFFNESRTHLTRKCRDPKNTDYAFWNYAATESSPK